MNPLVMYVATAGAFVAIMLIYAEQVLVHI